MKLRECIELGVVCGLDTMDEALYNVELHAVQMRELSMVDHELNELYQEIMDILGEKWANMTLTTAKKIIQ
jgi:hypothetical protein